MKISIIIPVYFNEMNLIDLYEDLNSKVFSKLECEYEVVMIDDGSKDSSYEIMKQLAEKDCHIFPYRLSRNFGSHAAILCGLEKCTGDCAVIKAADLEEPSELVLDMMEKWKEGYNVVLATREDREGKKKDIFFANMYYRIVRKLALKNMPLNGFDVYLLDRQVIDVLTSLEERNSALTGQILWCGFHTAEVGYTKKTREKGVSQWTIAKKIRLVTNTLFSFSTVPIRAIEVLGVLSFVASIIISVVEVIAKLSGHIPVAGWTGLFIFELMSFGIMMTAIGVVGEYIWRNFDASRGRPVFIVEQDRDKASAEETAHTDGVNTVE